MGNGEGSDGDGVPEVPTEEQLAEIVSQIPAEQKRLLEGIAAARNQLGAIEVDIKQKRAWLDTLREKVRLQFAGDPDGIAANLQMINQRENEVLESLEDLRNKTEEMIEASENVLRQNQEMLDFWKTIVS